MAVSTSNWRVGKPRCTASTLVHNEAELKPASTRLRGQNFCWSARHRRRRERTAARDSRSAELTRHRDDGKHERRAASGRAGYRRFARHRPRGRPGARRRRRPCHRSGAHPGRARGAGRRNPRAAPGRESPATLVPCDLRDHAAIDRLGEAIFRRWGRLDALVGNAGVLGPLSPLHHVDPKPWDDVLAVNVTANWRLIRALDPLLRRFAGRAGSSSSPRAPRIAAELRAYWGPYAVSKAALDALARTYAAETVNTSAIRVMLVNPGPLRTRMRAAAMPGEDPLSLRTPEELAPKIVEMCAPRMARDRQNLRLPAGRGDGFRAPA